MQRDKVILLLVTIIVVLVLGIQLYDSAYARVLTKSTFDGRLYLVRDTPHKQESADALARLNERILRLIHYMDNARDMAHIGGVQRLKARYRGSETVSEGLIKHGLTTFTENKDKITFCLRTRDQNDQLYNDNLLMYVALHELAHIMSITLDHTPEFKDNFQYLQVCAMKLGIFQRDGLMNGGAPVEYCGLHIHRV